VSRRYRAFLLGNSFRLPLASASVHCAITEPRFWTLRPHTREYDDRHLGNELSPNHYLERMVEVLRQVKRVLRDDGVFWLFMDDSYGGPIDRYPPDRAPIPQFVGNRLLIPQRLALALQDDDWIVRQISIWANTAVEPGHYAGWRILANGEVRRGSWRRTQAHKYLFMLTKRMQYWADSTRDDLTSVLYVATQPYQLAPFKQEIPTELIAPLIEATCPAWCCPVCGQGWAPKVASAEYGATCSHPHSQSEAVPGTVFDPFVGTGTTLLVARGLDRNAVGLDLNPEYLRFAAQRLGTP
jgi:hypothetical protein